MIGYIYIITNLKNNMQYVGQTIQTIQQRFSGHKSSANCKTDNTYLHKAMNKYGIENFEVKEITSVELDTLEDLSEELNFLEKYYIAEYNTLIPNGYNLTQGGSECAELYKKKVDEYDLNKRFIQTHDSIINASRSIGATNGNAVRKCCEGKSKFAFQRIWRYHGDSLDKYEFPDVDIASREYKLAPVDQYSKDGILLNSYNSMTEAALILGLDSPTSHIAECCNGKLYTAYNFVWRYKDESFNKYPTKEKRFMGCVKCDLDGNPLEVFDCIRDACISIGKDPKKVNSHITSCCKGNKKTAYGYKWKYITT